jgi:ATP-dependent DNA helicase RecQ
MNTLSSPREILLKYWNYQNFRPLQEDIINAALQGKDTLALLPTGGGKSICFQVPALCMEGLCIVVSPLIALMKDQVDSLRKKEIKAVAVNSIMSMKEIDIALDNCIYGNYKFLYVSPERLQTDIFLARLPKMNVNLIAVDEAHCISQWGYDFRPPYMKIKDIRQYIPNVPVLALTATATPDVVKDIQQKLGFKKEHVLRKSFNRPNLAYVVLHEEDKNKRMLKVIKNVGGSGIVYERSRRKTVETAAFLESNKNSSAFYHAGIDSLKRAAVQELWISNTVQVMVATNAFGMGIDKPDVRFVIHTTLTESLEAYFQEAGRAGRDEKKAYAVLLINEKDKLELKKRIETAFPEKDEIKQVYHALSNYFHLAMGSGADHFFEFDIADFCNKYKLEALRVINCIKFLEKEEHLLLTENVYMPSRLKITGTKEQLYEFQVANQEVDDVVKVMLRSYSGLFFEYVNIFENDIATRSKLDKAKVLNVIFRLQEHELVSYFPQSSLPKLSFGRGRIDTGLLTFSKENYELRKKVFQQKIEAVLHYADNKLFCRSRLLLAYFGETNSENCGVCDVCLERNKQELNTPDFEKIAETIKALLSVSSLGLKELVEQCASNKEVLVIKTLQQLMDEGTVIYDEENKLILNNE